MLLNSSDLVQYKISIIYHNGIINHSLTNYSTKGNNMNTGNLSNIVTRSGRNLPSPTQYTLVTPFGINLISSRPKDVNRLDSIVYIFISIINYYLQLRLGKNPGILYQPIRENMSNPPLIPRLIQSSFFYPSGINIPNLSQYAITRTGIYLPHSIPSNRP